MTRRTHGAVALGLLAFVSCKSEVPYDCPDPAVGSEGQDLTVGTGDQTPPDGDKPTPGDGPINTVPPGTTGTPSDPGTTPPEPQVLRFIAMGDGGRGNADQYAVADAIEQVCTEHGCDFAIYLGDNIYDAGVDGVDDAQFEEKFEAPYRALDFPFYMALGNHDWGGDASAQVEYTDHSDKWEMPDTYYTHVQGDATFVVLDTNSLNDGDQAQMDWAASEVTAASTTWKFAYGHHPYVSNGDHGNTGGDLESFFDASLCGNIDVYFAGHDHDLQWLEPVCGVEFVGSGAASSLRDVGGGNPTFFETSTLGFMWVEIVDRTFTGVFYDVDGNELFRRTIQK